MFGKNRVTFLALLATALLAGALGCSKTKETAKEVGDLTVGAADKTVDMMSSDWMTVQFTGPAGARVNVLKGRPRNPQNNKVQESFRVPFEMKVKVPDTLFLEIDSDSGKVYAKLDTLALTDYAKLNKVRLDLPAGVLGQAAGGKARAATIKDPNTGEGLIRINLGNMRPNL